MKTFKEFVSEMTYGRGRGPIGGADRNNSPRYRNLGFPTPEQEKENKSREDKAAADAVAKLRRARGMKEEVELDEGMTMKDFKKQRSRQKQKDKRAALKTSPTRRKGIHNPSASPERAARHRTNVDPDFEGDDESNYPGGKLRAKKVRKAKALGELGEENVQELFITKLTPEQKRKKKVETLIRLMKHAKDPAADVAKPKK